MPLARFSRLPEAKQAEILRIASEEIAEHGFEDASLSDVLVRAGLSKGSFYYYFEDKEDLLATVFDRLLDEYFQHFKPGSLEALTAEAFWPFVEKTLTESVEVLLSAPSLMKIMSHLPWALRSNPRLKPMQDRAAAYLKTAILAGQRVGCVRTDLTAERLIELWQAIDDVMDRAIIGRPTPMTRDELHAHMKLVFDMFRRVMVNRPGGTGAVS